MHLSILDGVAERYDTPFFDNLKKYAQRPIGTFHALPIARGKSIFKSNWIRDMGEFYGANLFLAEIVGDHRRARQPARADRQHQEGAGHGGARVRRRSRLLRHQRHVDVQQDGRTRRCCEPGDIVIVDRNCHKSHHYGMVLAGAQPLLRRSLPDDGVLDVRRRAAAHDQEGAARPARRRAGSTACKMVDADQLHLRRPHLQHAPRDGGVPGDQAGPDLPVGRGVVRLRPLLAVPTGRARRWARARRSSEAFARPRVPASGTRRRRSELGADLDPKDTRCSTRA